MFSLKQTALHFIVLAFLTVQYGSLLHAVEHPFHAHESDHHLVDAVFADEASEHLHEHDEQLSDAGINCDLFFAGERLAHAVLYVPPSAVSKAEHARYSIVHISFVLQQNKLRPRSRSPPVFLA